MVGLLVSLALIIYFIVSLDWSLVAHHLANLSWVLLLPILALSFVQYFLRAVRWKALLKDASQSPLSLFYDGLMIGNLASYLLPLRAGEVVRSALVASQAKLPFGECLTSVVIERLFDLLMVLTTFSVFSGALSQGDSWIRAGALSLTSAAGGLLLILLIAAFFPGFLRSSTAFLTTPLARRAPHVTSFLQKLCEQVLSSASVFRNVSLLVRVSLLSIAIWISVYAFFYAFLHASSEFPRSLTLAIVVCIVVSFAVAAPSAPGFLGVYQTGCITGFTLFGYSKELGMAFAILTHGFQYLFVVFSGLYSLQRQKLSWHSLSALRESF
jgi:glycosyltransferase 2 family protein